MKTIYTAICLAILAGTLAYVNNRLLRENSRLKANQETLLTNYNIALADAQKYKVADSLSAATVQSLTISLDEYKRARAEDYELIKKLRNAKQETNQIITTEVVTTDTILIPVYIKADSLQCFDYTSTWLDLSGCLNTNSKNIDLQYCNRESLKIVETTTYKRFLGFLWKTNKVKSRQIDIVSENPATQIIQAELINIEN